MLRVKVQHRVFFLVECDSRCVLLLLLLPRYNIYAHVCCKIVTFQYVVLYTRAHAPHVTKVCIFVLFYKYTLARAYVCHKYSNLQRRTRTNLFLASRNPSVNTQHSTTATSSLFPRWPRIARAQAAAATVRNWQSIFFYKITTKIKQQKRSYAFEFRCYLSSQFRNVSS